LHGEYVPLGRNIGSYRDIDRQSTTVDRQFVITIGKSRSMVMYFISLLLDELDVFGLFDLLDDMLFFDINDLDF
jgi:hypothetical protein